jgi:superfamily II DNA/RNA helicase
LPQLEALAAGVEIVVATPGRLSDFLNRQPPMLSLAKCEFLVLDEAGRGTS